MNLLFEYELTILLPTLKALYLWLFIGACVVTVQLVRYHLLKKPFAPWKRLIPVIIILVTIWPYLLFGVLRDYVRYIQGLLGNK